MRILSLFSSAASAVIVALQIRSAAGAPPLPLGLTTAPADQILPLSRQVRFDRQSSLPRNSIHAFLSQQHSKRDNQPGRIEQLNAHFSGVYASIDVKFPSPQGDQSFSMILDTGSSDSWVVWREFQCVDGKTSATLLQAACKFGPLFNDDGAFEPIDDEWSNVLYGPENNEMQGQMGYHDIELAGIRVRKQQLSIAKRTVFVGDGHFSGLLGMGYPALTAAFYKDKNGTKAPDYDPVPTSMVKQKLIDQPVFTLALDRVKRGTGSRAPAGVVAFGGLVDSKLYQTPFTTVPIEKKAPNTDYIWYVTTTSLVYNKKSTGKKISTGGTFQAVVDSGTHPNLIPTAAAHDINAQFDPPATYNATLGYWTVQCDAKAPPYVAFVIGGVEMPMDARDMIVQGMNALAGDAEKDVCFSAFADGDDPTKGNLMIIGESWLKNHVVVHDIENHLFHIAPRAPY